MCFCIRYCCCRICFIFFCGAAGAALFYGDALITPALSVLSAVEGLKLVTSSFDAYILPITIVIIFGLFFIQSRGTAEVARWFGPITIRVQQSMPVRQRTDQVIKNGGNLATAQTAACSNTHTA